MIKTLVFLTLLSTTFASVSKLHVEPDHSVDLREQIDLTEDVSHPIHKIVGTHRVDISTKRASRVFRSMEHTMRRGELTSYKFFLYQLEGLENGEMLVKWRIGTGDMGQREYTVTITTTDINDLDNPIHQQSVAFQCTNYEYYEKTLCVPFHCDLDPFKPEATPAEKCARNYHYSQTLIATVRESSYDLDQNDLGDGLYDETLNCYKQKVETMPVFSNEICYYEGFEPENITPLSEIEEKLFDDEWKKLEDGTYQRISERVKKTAEVRVDEEEMTLDDKNDPVNPN